MVVLGVSLIKNRKHKSILIKNNPSDFPRVKLLNTRMGARKICAMLKSEKDNTTGNYLCHCEGI